MVASIKRDEAKHSAARTVVAITRALRALDSEMQAQAIETFFTIAANPGIEMRELQTRTGLSSASMTRNIAYLGPYHKGREGLKLVEARERLEDRRVKQVFLTAKGERLLQTVHDELENMTRKG